MTPVWLPVLLASVGGSLHCAAMCGPFMAAVTGFGAAGRAGPATHAAYHAGRLGTYLGLGAVAGALGGALDVAGHAAGIARVSALVAGLVLAVGGASALVARPALVKLRRRAPSRLGSLLASVLTRIASFSPVPRALLLGFSTTLVPCGWLYAFVATAAGTGSVPSAIAVMLAFWAGTLPALALAGLGLSGIFARFGARARAVSALLIAASGVVLLGFRLEVAPASATIRTASPDVPGSAANCPLHRH
jgi:sulfite exporter TauE/SafE